MASFHPNHKMFKWNACDLLHTGNLSVCESRIYLYQCTWLKIAFTNTNSFTFHHIILGLWAWFFCCRLFTLLSFTFHLSKNELDFPHSFPNFFPAISTHVLMFLVFLCDYIQRIVNIILSFLLNLHSPSRELKEQGSWLFCCSCWNA